MKATLAASTPVGLAVDPLTRYLYIVGAETVHVVDATVNPPAVWKRSFHPGGLTSYQYQNIAFTDDGQKLYMGGKRTPTVNDQGAREFVRNDAGTPADYTDDTFAASGVGIQQTGVMPALGYGDVRSCTVDRNGKVYVGDLHATKPPVRRYIAGANTLDMEFNTTTRVWGCATDASNNFWPTDIADATSAHVTGTCHL